MLLRRFMPHGGALLRATQALRRLVGPAAAVLVLLAAAAPARAEVQPQDYLRSYLDVTGNYPAATETLDGAAEIRGVVQGKLRMGDTTTWLVRGGADQADTTYRMTSAADYPEIDLGMRVRALGHGALASTATLELVSIITEARMAEWEQANAPRSPAAKAADPSAAKQTSTRIATFPSAPVAAARQVARQYAPRKALTQAERSGPVGFSQSPPGGPQPPRWRAPQGGANTQATRVAQAQNSALTSRGATAYLEAYRRAVRWFNPRLTLGQADVIARSILGFSAQNSLDPRLVVAIIAVESNFSLTSTSSKGAMGLGQLMPGTAAGLGVQNAYDPVQNIWGAVRLLRGHLQTHADKPFWDRIALALASYNAGSGAVRRFGGVPPYRETQRYIVKVQQLYKHLCGISE